MTVIGVDWLSHPLLSLPAGGTRRRVADLRPGEVFRFVDDARVPAFMCLWVLTEKSSTRFGVSELGITSFRSEARILPNINTVIVDDGFASGA